MKDVPYIYPILSSFLCVSSIASPYIFLNINNFITDLMHNFFRISFILPVCKGCISVPHVPGFVIHDLTYNVISSLK